MSYVPNLTTHGLKSYARSPIQDQKSKGYLRGSLFYHQFVESVSPHCMFQAVPSVPSSALFKPGVLGQKTGVAHVTHF